jgi:hypothetical protein
MNRNVAFIAATGLSILHGSFGIHAEAKTCGDLTKVSLTGTVVDSAGVVAAGSPATRKMPRTSSASSQVAVLAHPERSRADQ